MTHPRHDAPFAEMVHMRPSAVTPSVKERSAHQGPSNTRELPGAVEIGGGYRVPRGADFLTGAVGLRARRAGWVAGPARRGRQRRRGLVWHEGRGPSPGSARSLPDTDMSLT
jgi:hypothetical protein